MESVLAEANTAVLSTAFETIEEKQEEDNEPWLHPHSPKKRHNIGLVIRIEEGTQAVFELPYKSTTEATSTTLVAGSSYVIESPSTYM